MLFLSKFNNKGWQSKSNRNLQPLNLKHYEQAQFEKQQFRNRLFVIWFNNYENRHNYVLKTAEGKLEGQDNFMALIAQADNPRLAQVLEEFEETAAILFDPAP